VGIGDSYIFLFINGFAIRIIALNFSSFIIP
jgi:hypothetical protein